MGICAEISRISYCFHRISPTIKRCTNGVHRPMSMFSLSFTMFSGKKKLYYCLLLIMFFKINQLLVNLSDINSLNKKVGAKVGAKLDYISAIN